MRATKTPREGRIFGRTRSRRKGNVAVYCDAEGWTRIDYWQAGGTRARKSLPLTTEEARVLRRALGEYLGVG